MRTRSSGPGRPHRPSRLPAAAVPGCPERIGWLLRVNRRFRPGGPDVPLAGFAARLAAEGCPASAGQVSRWETGRLPVPHRVVVAYEKVLGLPRDHLVSVVDGVYRHRTDRPAPSRLDRFARPDCSDRPDCFDRTGPSAIARAEDLLDRALFGGRMSGAAWDELTALLTCGNTVVMPGRLWARLAQRLLAEQLVSDGDAWRQRSESTHRLLWLPASRRHVIGACAAVVRDPASQTVIEPLAVLDVVGDPAVSALLAGQITAPVSERALRGALSAAAAQVRHRRFGPDQLGRIASAVVDLLTDPAWSAAAHPLAAELLSGLPLRSRTAAALRLRATTGASARPDFAGGPLRLMSDRIAAATLSHTGAYDDGSPDEMLACLVGEMVSGANPDVRLHAAQLLGATPFRTALADACCAELRKPAVAGDPARAGALLEALPFVAGPGHRPAVEALVTAPGLPAETTAAAAWSIAHVPGTSSDLFWTAALRHPAGRRGLTYALGVTGRRDWLTRLHRDPDMPAEVRAAARWWSNLPAAVARDARR